MCIVKNRVKVRCYPYFLIRQLEYVRFSLALLNNVFKYFIKRLLNLIHLCVCTHGHTLTQTEDQLYIDRLSHGWRIWCSMDLSLIIAFLAGKTTTERKFDSEYIYVCVCEQCTNDLFLSQSLSIWFDMLLMPGITTHNPKIVISHYDLLVACFFIPFHSTMSHIRMHSPLYISPFHLAFLFIKGQGCSRRKIHTI